MIRRILVGTSEAGQADPAVAAATRLASTFDAELVVLRLEPVIDARRLFDPDGLPEPPEASTGAVEEASTRQSVRARGNVVRAVCEAAVREHADLIVLPQGRSVSGRIMSLRASRAVVERAPCPVVLVAS